MKMKSLPVQRQALSKRASRHRQRGASLLEAIAYLGIAAIVVIGAVALLNGAFSSASTNALSEQVSAIQTGVKKLYMGQSSGYTGITTATLVGAGVFPSTMPAAADGTVSNAWGAAVLIAAGTAPGTFTIEYDNVPAAVCVNAVTAGGSWTSIAINGTAVTAMPVSPTDATADCSAGTANKIIWTST
jgi:hypothetical protein